MVGAISTIIVVVVVVIDYYVGSHTKKESTVLRYLNSNLTNHVLARFIFDKNLSQLISLAHFIITTLPY